MATHGDVEAIQRYTEQPLPKSVLEGTSGNPLHDSQGQGPDVVPVVKGGAAGVVMLTFLSEALNADFRCSRSCLRSRIGPSNASQVASVDCGSTQV